MSALFISGVQAQQYTIGVHSGMFTPIDYGSRYPNAQLGYSMGLSFDYRFQGKLSLGAHYQFGKFSYSPELQQGFLERSAVPVHLIYWTLQRNFSLGNDWKLAAGTGPGFFLASYPDERDSQTGLPLFTRDFSMPLLLNLYKPLGTIATIGLKTGLFFTPFYAIGGFHLGPEIRFLF
ncbi:outer membrane beta-barrel protein [Cyclobacterium plantarum]|uniref:Outer membrane protein beta-barrel domain-containing protein n=1 Tax=Cyclobacterium plantarum TaxID=2716263 RepID=A0ABX0HGJ6_9BACT|nr:outer membrane beta-barrel protein [Cyclobacterium plantarum]NHE59251.1 hypothetical protein [Cyclobacterium plantarum]